MAAQVMGYYSGTSLPLSLISSTNSVLIHFYSDGSVTYTGFQLEYQKYSEISLFDFSH